MPDPRPKKKRKPKKKAGTDASVEEAPPATLTVTQPADEGTANGVQRTEESGDSGSESEPQPEPDKDDSSAGDVVADADTNEEPASSLVNGAASLSVSDGPSDATERFDALFRDRNALRAEVAQLRQSLEEIQTKHESELLQKDDQLQEAQSDKERLEEDYQNLVGRLNTIRSQLGQRLKADAEELEQTRTRIEELEDQKSSLQEQYTAKSAECEELVTEAQAQSKELSTLRNRATLSQQNWIRERNELVESEAYIREEFESAKQAMHDWEVLAMEERSVRKDLADKVGDLEEQLTNLRELYEKANSERESQSNTVDGLQRALQEIQNARKRELREMVETHQAEIETLKKQLSDVQTKAETPTLELAAAKKELERALPFEKEVKEKNLLIGKLRHEAVILNDHLTKALRFLKRGKPEDNVDRQIVTNYLLHFLALDRADPKKFQSLQLIAALLGWTDEQREQAGLARPGNGKSSGGFTSSLRLPMSPSVHRTPSTPALASEYFGAGDGSNVGSPASKETLAQLWQDFLEQESSNTQGSKPGTKSRTASIVSSGTAASTPKP